MLFMVHRNYFIWYLHLDIDINFTKVVSYSRSLSYLHWSDICFFIEITNDFIGCFLKHFRLYVFVHVYYDCLYLFVVVLIYQQEDS